VVTFRGDPMDYREKVRRFLRVAPDAIPDTQLQQWTQQVDKMLFGLGYDKGDLGERIKAWEAANTVPANDVLPVLKQMMDEARQRTVDMLFALPDDAQMEAVGIHGVPFGAYADYPNRQVLLNIDHPYTRYSLKRLACHEGFPGHCAHMSLRDQWTHSGEMPVDGALVVTNSASSPLFEGIADFSIEFIDWTNGAYQARVSFMNQAAAASRLGFLTHKLRAPFAFAYWCGDRAVERVWRTVTREQRPEFFTYIYRNMHTPTTLHNYWKP
jgi:hypothetical protein